ncbi:MAG: aldehyde dehydrogenase [Calditrichaeota bacterium]|nr:aldehyde dehydrogenase [Calditrichota bacterium]MCB9365827.1 aldehyde dehydrogenase [Calditrichota bacterium]
MSEKLYPNIINGEHVPALSGKTLALQNPATGEALGMIPLSGADDIDKAVAAARSALNGKWGRQAASARTKILFKAAELMNARAKEIAELESRNMGKPVMHVMGEVKQAIEDFEYFAGAASKVEGRVPPVHPVFFGYTLKEPVGVVGAITPWNYPIMLESWKLAPALAAGCTVVLKPSEIAPCTANILVEILHEAGCPEGTINLVHGTGESAGAALVKHPGVNKISFTGGTDTGRAIMKECANDMKRVMLELGGKSPAIVCEDANLNDAVLSSVFTIFYSAGQSCEARSRIYVHDSLYDSFVEKFVAATKQLVIGDPLDKNTHIGALAHPSRLPIMQKFIEAAKQGGGKILCGGEQLKGGIYDQGCFFAPTVIVDLPEDNLCVQEEIFGPIVVISKFISDDDALAKANGVKYGLCATLYTENMPRATKFIRGLHSGIVTLNTPATALPGLPFGGVKQSGVGREMAMDTLESYLETKTVLSGVTGKPINPFGLTLS